MRFVESAEMRVVDRSSKQLNEINRKLRALGVTARKLQNDLSKLTMPTPAAKGSITTTLRRQSAEAKSTSRALDKLAGSYTTAASAADRLTSAAIRANSQMRRLGATSRSVAQLGASLSAGGRGGGHGARGGYSAHIPTNPGHFLANRAAHEAFGNNLSLPQVGTIAIAGSVVLHAGHVALEGAKERSTAEERMFQRGASPGDIAWAKKEASRVSAKFQTTSIADNMETLTDISAAVHDRSGQAQLMELLAKRQQLMSGQGQDGKEVRDSNVRLIKTLEMSGSLVDQNGHFNADRTNAMMNMIQGVEAVEGRNIDARQIQMAFKYLKENALTQSPENMRNVLFLGAEVGGSTAGNNLTSAINGLTGKAPKEVLANMIRSGLATGEIDAKGKIKNYQLKNEELLRGDFGGWLNQMVQPILDQKGIDPKQNPVALSKFLSTITGRTTQKDILMKWFTQLRENANKAAAASNVRQDDKTAQGVVNRDYHAAFSAFERQAESAFGEVGAKLNNLVISPLNGATNVLTDIAKILVGTATEAEKGHVVKAGAGAAGLAGAGLFGAGKALGLFNPLNGAATALTGSATALTSAAAALSGAAGVGGAGGLGGTVAKDLTARSLWQVAGRTFAVVAGAYLVERLGEAWLEKISPDAGKKVREFREGAENEAISKTGDALTILTGGSLAEVKVQQLTEIERLKKLNAESLQLQKRLSDLGDAYSRDKNGSASRAIENETADILKRFERNARSATEASAGMALRNFGPDPGSFGAQVGANAIPRGSFLLSTTYESTLEKFSKGTKDFENLGGKVGADLAEKARESLASSWGDAAKALKDGGESVAASIRGALSAGVSVSIREAGPSTGSASPSKQ